MNSIERSRRKPGPSRQHYVTTSNETIVGLARLVDGRWRVLGTQTRFTEPDETKAIAKFRRLTGEVTEDDFYPQPKQQQRMWARWFAGELQSRPEWVAKMFGIPELGNLKYLASLKPPEPLPTFRELENLWKQSSKSHLYKRQVLVYWKLFLKLTRISSLSDITDKVALSFRNQIYSLGYAAKTQSHIFGNIRAFLSHATHEAVAVKPIAEIITILQRVLICNGKIKRVNPNPLSPEDFQSLLKHADARQRAMCLLFLNGAFNKPDLTRITWKMVKSGCIYLEREKTGSILRACPLWPETIAALNKLPKDGDYLFYGQHGRPIGTRALEEWFKDLRKAAGLKVTLKQFRSGAATAVRMAGIPKQQLDTLLGHSGGIDDHYILANPTMVKPATDAIHKCYFEDGGKGT